MRKVGSRELKNRLGRYLELVKRGDSLVITDRGKPVAQIVPAPGDTRKPDLGALLSRLEADGHLRIARRPLHRFRPVKVKGKSASRIILEGRR